jgi:diguanylate cyclase (GGDEF)-like protein/PAS domain S-box-containing protein
VVRLTQGPRQPPKRRDTPSAADELRRQAEARLDGLSAVASSVPEDVAAVVHDLRVHQIELEMQNEELRRAQLDLQASREKYFELFDLAPVGYLTLSDKSLVGNANFAAARLLGVERQQLVGRPFNDFIFAPDRDVYYLYQRKLERTGESQTCRLRLRRAGGEAAAAAKAGADVEAGRFWAHLEGRPWPAADGEPPSTWVTFTDVQDIVVREEELDHLNDDVAARAAALEAANATITLIAATDHLTGLANRRRFLESLGKAVSLARRHGSPLALASFDLDGLKRVNDSFGHAAGDGVLTSFAQLLGALCRAEDLPARLGGDEFSVLLPGIDLSGARGLADRVLAAVCSCAALERRGVTVSGGLAAWTPNEAPDDLLRRADHALYVAKRGGGAMVTGDE